MTTRMLRSSLGGSRTNEHRAQLERIHAIGQVGSGSILVLVSLDPDQTKPTGTGPRAGLTRSVQMIVRQYQRKTHRRELRKKSRLRARSTCDGLLKCRNCLFRWQQLRRMGKSVILVWLLWSITPQCRKLFCDQCNGTGARHKRNTALVRSNDHP